MRIKRYHDFGSLDQSRPSYAPLSLIFAKDDDDDDDDGDDGDDDGDCPWLFFRTRCPATPLFRDIVAGCARYDMAPYEPARIPCLSRTGGCCCHD